MLKITLFTTDLACTEIVSFKSSHSTSFNKDGNQIYHCFDDELLKAITILVKYKIPFKVDFNNLWIDSTKVRIRIDSASN